jgi:glycerate dehydrogenase
LKNVLVSGPFAKEDLAELAGSANLYFLRDMSREDVEALLPSIDCILVHFWPKELTIEMVTKMTRLSFVQSALAGVNHIPFKDLPPNVVVSSNAGGYSQEVAEYAWGLLLAAAKRIVKFNAAPKENGLKSPLELGKEVVVLRGRVLGVLGYGGIGSSVARIGSGFEMKVKAFSRKEVTDKSVSTLSGEAGLKKILSESDVLVIALPLTNSTRKMIGEAELGMMKKDAILVNVARAEIVDQEAVYHHLLRNKGFVYATDVWWTKDGKEAIPPELPFFGLENFIGTPHVAGPSAVAHGAPLDSAVDNTLRFARGEAVKNVVDRADYV